MFKKTPIPAKVTFYTISRAFVSCLGCQHFISDWLGKLKPNKLSTGCQNELKGAAVEKATNPGRRFLFFSRLRRSFSRASRANFSWLRRSCARLDKTAILRRLKQIRIHKSFTKRPKTDKDAQVKSLRFYCNTISNLIAVKRSGSLCCWHLFE